MLREEFQKVMGNDLFDLHNPRFRCELKKFEGTSLEGPARLVVVNARELSPGFAEDIRNPFRETIDLFT